MEYCVQFASSPPPLEGEWNRTPWNHADTLEISRFHRASKSHRPFTQARVLYDKAGLYVSFHVRDQYLRAIATEYLGKVYEDACVEFFVQPHGRGGYFNFEMNCAGNALIYYIEDPERLSDGRIKKFTSVDRKFFEKMRVYHSLSGPILQEVEYPIEWKLSYFIPFSLLEAYVGSLGDIPGQTWRANFYKCAENNTHPHWGAWSSIGEKLNFHQPCFFGDIHFMDYVPEQT